MFNSGSIIGCFLAFMMFTCVETSAKSKIVPYAAFAGGISYSGLSTYLNAGIERGRHSVYAGPKMLVSQSFLPGKSLLGFNAGYLYKGFEQGEWALLANIDYQYTGYLPVTAPKTNHIHELAAAFRVNYSPVKNLSIGLGLGAGVYIENYYNKYKLARNSNSGLAPLIRLGLRYRFSK